MQFILIARDYTDGEALTRRKAARSQHIALSETIKSQQLYGVAMLNDKGDVCGSVMVLDFPSRKELDAWLAMEPYVTEKVWEHIEVIEGRVGPSFLAR